MVRTGAKMAQRRISTVQVVVVRLMVALEISMALLLLSTHRKGRR
jgi:hypothetical protein